jgi:secreted trypsin-like serine protease
MKTELQAAHCVDSFDEIYVYLGMINRVKGPFAWTSEQIKSEHIIVHPTFNPYLLTNDIALVYLDEAPDDLLDREHVATLALPSESDVDVNLEAIDATVSGFGRENDTSGPSTYLNYVTMPIIPNDICYRTFPRNVLSSSVCTNTTGGKSACSGEFLILFLISLI